MAVRCTQPGPPPRSGRHPGKGFTIVEVLIVVMIMGILAAAILPKLSNASETARAGMLKDDLRIIRIQLSVFRAEHRELPAGYPEGVRTAPPTEEALRRHLCLASNAEGQTAAVGTPGYPFGPYLRRIPENPVNSKNTVQVIGDDEAMPTAGDNSHGWIHKPATQNFRADSPGKDDDDCSYFGY